MAKRARNGDRGIVATDPHILAIDQGTTSTRAIVFDRLGNSVATAARELPQIYPRSGWVEHEPEEIWQATLAVCRAVLAEADGAGRDVVAIGITNQRETTVVWDRVTGVPIHNAIVWQDRRTADLCRSLSAAGAADDVTARTGLVVDPYFSGTKVAWLLENVADARARAAAGDLAFGTIDSFLLWRLTGGRVHATDATNACRTMLFNIHEQRWDDTLLARLDVPSALLPAVHDNAAAFGDTDAAVFGRTLPVAGMAGDQHAATVGQACFSPGMIKSTYGTGCFAVLNTGEAPVVSRNRMLTTLAYRIGGRTTYALEGSIFAAGATVQWLRDDIGLITGAADSEAVARSIDDVRGVYLVPAFTGLGAPYWDPDARGAILGLTRDTGHAEIVRAGLEAVSYQTSDLIGAMAADTGTRPTALRVDGGMAVNDWLMQDLSNVLGMPVDRPVVTETTALGAAYLAGLQVGVYRSLGEIAAQWRLEARFEPALAATDRERRLAGWADAVARVRSR